MHRRHFLSASLTSWVIACSARNEFTYEGDAPPLESSWRGPVAIDDRAFPQSVASGDPKPTSVVLWTRAPNTAVVYLQVALDEDFTQLVALSDAVGPVLDLAVHALASHDFCVKVRVDELQPGTGYFYRFLVETESGMRASRTGRTKTAPRETANVGVRFAVLSCQDFSAYYHALDRVVELAPDFVVHLGDYIYETADDPSFQLSSPERSIRFRDEAGAVSLELAPADGEPARKVLAARSLDNYRQLYQVYRNDRSLQRLHETTPMVAVWDDHEFANDATAQRTPTNSEPDPERRLNADQAWFEYMPVDYPTEPALKSAPYPDNLRIYRDFRFGSHLHLVMTDLRRYRPPHLIQEDTFPGRVLADESQLLAALGELPALARPYVDLELPERLQLAEMLRTQASRWSLPSAVFSGKLDLAYLNTWLERLNNEGTPAPVPLFEATDADGLGLAAIHAGKTELFSSFGARYLVVQEVFELLARVRYKESEGASEQLMGPEQRAWFIDTLRSSEATWKVWGNEYTFLQKNADLSALPVPDPRLKDRFLLSVEDWDGAPNERRALLSELADVQNLAIVTGDIHSFFVGTPGASERTPVGSEPVEFVCGAVSSATYERLLTTLVAIDGFGDIAPLAGAILTFSNPHVSFSDLQSNGFGLFDVDGERMRATFHRIASANVAKAELPMPLDDHFAVTSFVLAKDGTLVQEEE